MNKLQLIRSIFSLTALMSMPVIGIPQQVNTQFSQEAEVLMHVEPTYIISIPTHTQLVYDVVSTNMGSIQASYLQIEPTMSVSVSAIEGKLTNVKHQDNHIPYTLMNGAEPFSKTSFTDVDKKVELTIVVAKEAWNKAVGGEYQGTITFLIAYEKEDTQSAIKR